MNGWMFAGGVAGVCLVAAFVWLVISTTYDEAFEHGFEAGRAYGRKEAAK